MYWPDSGAWPNVSPMHWHDSEPAPSKNRQGTQLEPRFRVTIILPPYTAGIQLGFMRTVKTSFQCTIGFKYVTLLISRPMRPMRWNLQWLRRRGLPNPRTHRHGTRHSASLRCAATPISPALSVIGLLLRDRVQPHENLRANLSKTAHHDNPRDNLTSTPSHPAIQTSKNPNHLHKKHFAKLSGNSRLGTCTQHVRGCPADRHRDV